MTSTTNCLLCVEMAQITSEGAEQDSQSTSEQNRTGETADTGEQGQAVPDPRQEPGDSSESAGGMDASSGRDEAAEPGHDPAPAPQSDKETAQLEPEERERADELCDPGKSPVQGSLASSTESAQEGSRVLGAEQREGGTGGTKPAERAEQGPKRRASVELSSSDGEPLSRMDSEDRSVEVGNALNRPHTRCGGSRGRRELAAPATVHRALAPRGSPSPHGAEAPWSRGSRCGALDGPSC